MAFSVTNLSKAFSGVPVLRGVDFEVNDGEIHALLGANGAGKSTLIKCISGAYTPDSGEIFVGGKQFTSLNPKLAQSAGVAVIYQDLSLASTLDVTDNIFLGQELKLGPFVRKRAQRQEVSDWLNRLGIKFDAREQLSRLSNAELQVIEIVKALRANSEVLILDEPTASLTESEADKLRQHLFALKAENLPILYVTHRLGEVFSTADRVTILRGGEVVLSKAVKDVDQPELVNAIVGQELGTTRNIQDIELRKPGSKILSVKQLLSPRIGPLDFDVYPGEILGIFGLTGSGRTELLETLFGAQKLFSGEVQLNGHDLKLSHPFDAVKAGIALVPADRLRKGLLGDLSSHDNTLLPRFRQISRFGFRRPKIERKRFLDVATRLNLQPLRGDQEGRRFSGGNQQKLVLGRWLQEGDQTQILLLDEPTQGVDVGARRELYEGLRSFAGSHNRAVVMTSSEPEELLQLAHRVIVLSGGHIIGTIAGQDISEHRLLELAHKEEFTSEHSSYQAA